MYESTFLQRCRHTLLLFFLSVLLCCSSKADVPPLTRQVLLPDGQPAVGAQVFMRTFDGVNKWKWAYHTATDADGIYSVPRALVHSSDSTFFVEMSGCAPVLSVQVSFHSNDKRSGRLRPLQLVPSFRVTGRVTRNGQPVEGATVSIGRSRGGSSLSLSAMDAVWHSVSDPKGAFSFDGLICEGNNGFAVTRVEARAHTDGRLWIGATLFQTPQIYNASPSRTVPANSYGASVQPRWPQLQTVQFDSANRYEAQSRSPAKADIELLPTWVFRGRILNGDGTPATGAIVVRNDTIGGRARADEQGLSHLLRLAPKDLARHQITAEIRFPQTSYMPVFRYSNPAFARAEDFEDVIRLPRLVTVRGRITLGPGHTVPEVFTIYTRWKSGALSHSTSILLRRAAQLPGVTRPVPFSITLPVGINYLYSSQVIEFHGVGEVGQTSPAAFAEVLRPAQARQAGLLEASTVRLCVPPAGLNDLSLRARSLSSQSGTRRITRQVLSPDGEPAANIPVWLLLNQDTPQRYRRIMTDESGTFIADVPWRLEGVITNDDRSFALIDTAGAALALISLDEPRTDRETVRLRGLYFWEGRVVHENGRPVAGARVALMPPQVSTLLTPSALASDTPPQPLWTYTDQAGRWRLRGLGNWPDNSALLLPAEVRIGNEIWSGGTFAPLEREAGGALVLPSAGQTRRVPDIVLRPTITIKGRVLDPQSQPLAGVWVGLYKNAPSWRKIALPLPNGSITDTNGRFVLEGVPLRALPNPHDLSIHALRTNVGVAVAWLGVREEFDALAAWRKAGEVTLQFADLELIKGRVVDAHMNRPTGVAMQISAWRGKYLQHGLVHAAQEFRGLSGEIRLSPATVRSADGSFEVLAPRGSNTFRLEEREQHHWNEVYRNIDAYETETTVQPSRDGQTVIVKARKKPGWFFNVALPPFEYGNSYAAHDRNEIRAGLRLELRQNGTSLPLVIAPYRWFVPAKKWGEHLEYRLLQRDAATGSEIVLIPWTRVHADPKRWPILLPLPQ